MITENEQDSIIMHGTHNLLERGVDLLQLGGHGGVVGAVPMTHVINTEEVREYHLMAKGKGKR